jgi:hypothetical protein
LRIECLTGIDYARFSVAFVLSAAWTAIAQTGLPKPESWLLQSLYLSGTTVDGFKKTCLIVFKNSDYHREQRRQFVLSDGSASSRERIANNDSPPPSHLVNKDLFGDDPVGPLNELHEDCGTA